MRQKWNGTHLLSTWHEWMANKSQNLLILEHGCVHVFSTNESNCTTFRRSCKNTFCIWDVSNSASEVMWLFWMFPNTSHRCNDNDWLWFASNTMSSNPCRRCTQNSLTVTVGSASRRDVFECTHQVRSHFFRAIDTNSTHMNRQAVHLQSNRMANIRRSKIQQHFPEQNKRQIVACTMYWKHFRMMYLVQHLIPRTLTNWSSNLGPIRGDLCQSSLYTNHRYHPQMSTHCNQPRIDLFSELNFRISSRQMKSISFVQFM